MCPPPPRNQLKTGGKIDQELKKKLKIYILKA